MTGWSRPGARRRLRLLTLNVRGLKEARKRSSLFLRLMTGGHDIVVLQEVHAAGMEEAQAWLAAGAGPGRPWRGESFWSPGQGASRGVAILFRDNFAGTNLQEEFSDGPTAGPTSRGRVLRVGWRDQHTDQPWSVIAIYAPNTEAEQRTFFAEDGPVCQALAAGPTDANVILAGDFNNTLVVEDSSSRDAADQTQRAGAMALGDLVAHAGMEDAWLHHRARTPPQGASGLPESRFTFWAACGTARRLDRAYVSDRLITGGFLISCHHHPVGSFPGDHAAVELTLALQGVAAQGPPRWRLQLDLLGDPNFALDVTTELDCMRRLSGRNWESMATSSAMERWLRLKHRVGEMARSHARRRRAAAEAQRATLQRQVLHAAAAHAGPTRSGQPPPGGAGAPPVSAAVAARTVRTAAARLRAFDLAAAGRDLSLIHI